MQFFYSLISQRIFFNYLRINVNKVIRGQMLSAYHVIQVLVLQKSVLKEKSK